MSLALLTDVSRYAVQAAFNPIPVYLARRDIAYSAVSEVSGKVAFTVGTNLGLAADTLVYIEMSSGYDWSGWHTVTSCTSTQVVVSTSWVAGVSTGYLSSNELYENYYVLLQVRDNRTGTSLVELKYSLDNTMQVYINLSGIVRVLLGKDNNYGYHTDVSPPAVDNNIGEADENLMCNFSFRFKEGYLDDDDSPSPTWSTNYFGYAINAAMQLGENPTMATWMAFGGLGRFHTEFETITVFKGYPNCVSFMWFDSVLSSEDYTVARVQTFLARETKEELVPYAGLTENMIRVTIDDQSDNERSGTIKMQAYDSDVTPPNYFTVIAEIPLIYDDGVCYDNPMYLCWLNIYGGFSYWLFHTTQEVKHEVFDQKEILHTVEDWENARTQEDVFELNARDKFVLGAQDISEDQLVGIKNMLHSPRVMLLLNPTGFAGGAAPDWLTVTIQSGTFSFGSTKDSKYKVEFTIRKPRINIQQL